MTVSMAEYWKDKDRFFKKHKHDFQTYTSSMNEYGCWYKDYVFADGAQWHEDYSPVYESGIAIVRGVEVKIDGIKLLRTEYYSTESGSKYTYEKY